MSVYTPACEDGPLVNVYKHWSAYTGASIEEADQFINAYGEWADENPEEKKIFGKTDEASIARQKEIIALVMMKAWPRAHPAGFHKDGITEYDSDKDPEAGEKYAADVKMLLMAKGMPNLAAKLQDVFSYDRNEGLIGVTEHAIEDYQSWSEGDVDIRIDSEGNIYELYFGVLWGSEWAEAVEECEHGEKELKKEIYDTEFCTDDDFGVFDMADWEKFKDIYDAARAAGKFKIGCKKNNAVWSFIE